MTYEEFSRLLGGGWEDKIIAACQFEGCVRTEHIKKKSALANFKRNGLFKCRQCSFTKEGKEAISRATKYKRTDATRDRMSNAKKQYYETEAGKAYRAKLSVGLNVKSINPSRRRGYYPSMITGRSMYYDSGYELRAMWLLDQDVEVRTYDSQVPFCIDGKNRRLDLLVTYHNGLTKVIEVKPASRLNEESVGLQLEHNQSYAEFHGHLFEIWTEAELGFRNPRDLVKWCDSYMSQLQGIDYVAIRKKNDCRRVKRYKQRHYNDLHITFWCEYCQEEHTHHKWHHEQNVAKNGRYICIKENGHIIGSLPKLYLRKENPYAVEDKKQCNLCAEILPIEQFDSDISRKDGHSNYCKKCTSQKNKERYERRKAKKENK